MYYWYLEWVKQCVFLVSNSSTFMQYQKPLGDVIPNCWGDVMFKFEYDVAEDVYWILDEEGYVVDKVKNLYAAHAIVDRLNEENE